MVGVYLLMLAAIGIGCGVKDAKDRGENPVGELGRWLLYCIAGIILIQGVAFGLEIISSIVQLFIQLFVELFTLFIQLLTWTL